MLALVLIVPLAVLNASPSTLFGAADALSAAVEIRDNARAPTALAHVAFRKGLQQVEEMVGLTAVSHGNKQQHADPSSIQRIVPGDKLSPPVNTQMDESQIKIINEALTRHSVSKRGNGANLLIWGLGNDSPFWTTLTSGRVVFIEDSPDWITEMTAKYPMLEVYQMNYTTLISRDFDRYTRSAAHWAELDLRSKLPADVVSEDWDVIIVDAPMGYAPSNVGRFSSIYTSKLLVKKPTDIFVDDCERRVENLMGSAVYGKRNLLGHVHRSRTEWRAGKMQCHFFVAPTKEEDDDVVGQLVAKSMG